MKDIFKLILQGIVIGLSGAASLYLIITVFENRSAPTTFNKVKKHYLVENAKFTTPSPGKVEGDFVTTVTFSVNNTKGREINSVFIDIEFFDEDGEFLFDGVHGTPWGDFLIPPKEKDNMSLEVYVPPGIDFTRVAKVTADVYELSRK